MPQTPQSLLGRVDLGVFVVAGCMWDVPTEQEKMQGIAALE